MFVGAVGQSLIGLAGSATFHMLCAKAVNQEAWLTSANARRLQRALHERQLERPVPEQSGSFYGVHRVKRRALQRDRGQSAHVLRAPTARDLFRFELMETQRPRSAVVVHLHESVSVVMAGSLEHKCTQGTNDECGLAKAMPKALAEQVPVVSGLLPLVLLGGAPSLPLQTFMRKFLMVLSSSSRSSQAATSHSKPGRLC